MANRVINTILNLRDNMSGGLIRRPGTRRVLRGRWRAPPGAWWPSKTAPSPRWAAPPRAFAKWGAASAGAVTAAFLAMDSATEEYRIAQGKLNTAYEAAGYNAETAATAK